MVRPVSFIQKMLVEHLTMHQMPGEKINTEGQCINHPLHPIPKRSCYRGVTQAGQGTPPGGAIHASYHMGFPGGASGKEPASQGRQHKRPRFNPWVRNSSRRKWQPAPVFLPGESHGQRSLAGYSPWGHTELDMTEVT